MVDYCVIQFPRQVVAGSIDRQLRAGCGDDLERVVATIRPTREERTRASRDSGDKHQEGEAGTALDCQMPANSRTGMSGLMRFISARTALAVASGRLYPRTLATFRVVNKHRA